MPMLAGDLAREIRYAMRIGEDQDDGSYTSVMDAINQAGQRIVTAKRWKFLDGGVATLTFDASGEVTLPADFDDLISVYFDGCAAIITNNSRVEQVTDGHQTNLLAVSNKATATGHQYALVSNKGVGDTVKITYRRGWVNVNKDEDAIFMPEWMRPLMAEACRKQAELIEGGDPMLIDQVLRGPLMAEATKRDGLTNPYQGSYGVQRSGSNEGSIYVPVGSDWLTP